MMNFDELTQEEMFLMGVSQEEMFLIDEISDLQNPEQISQEERFVIQDIKELDAKNELFEQFQTFRETSRDGDTITFNLDDSLDVKTIANLIKRTLTSTDESRFVIAIGTQTYSITDAFLKRIEENLSGVQMLVRDGVGSDQEVINEIDFFRSLTVERFPIGGKKNKRGGAFFHYYNNSKLNLERQGIFSEYNKEMNETCLVRALRLGGLEDEKISELKIMCQSHIIPISDLNKITNKLKIHITLQKVGEGKRKTRKLYYGDVKDKDYDLGLVASHFFLNEKTNITKYALVNDLPIHKFNLRLKGNKTQTTTAFIDTFKAVSLLMEHKDKFLKPISVDENIMNTPYYNDIKTFDTLEYVSDNSRSIENKEKKKPVRDKIFFDFETNTEGQHTPYLGHYVHDDEPDKIHEFKGKFCGLEMLKSLKNNTLMIAHNAGYDSNFIVKWLFCDTTIKKSGGNLISHNGLFHNSDTGETISIQIKDSMKFIPKALKKFGEMFKLEQEKEIMPYSIYTKENIRNRNVRVVDLQKCNELEDKKNYEQFIDNCDKWNLIVNGKVDIVEYSSRYCRIDCEVLRNGYNIFRGWMLEVTDIDIDNVLTIPSLVHKYFINEGVYDDVCELSGIPRAFIQKCVVGGRTMCGDNKPVNIKMKKGEKMQDFDAVSLYPSAMNRMDGFLIGSPKILQNLTYDFLSKQSGYFVKILIKSVGVHRSFPLMSYVGDSGVRNFTNDMIGKTMHVDRIVLEDLIKYQHITFDIIQGYYFDEGHNTRIKDIIHHLFEERLKKKNEGNPIQEVYKLIMNSSYGKSLLKPVVKDLKIFNNKEMLYKHINNNFDYIMSWFPLEGSNKWIVEEIKTINEHFSIPQVGVEILSMSKRIMNEVMCLAEDNKLPIYYTDTDSMHIEEKSIIKLKELYRNEYKKELVGKGMGQFHSDFSFNGCKDVYSTHLITLGKKCYIDKLKGIDKKTGDEKVGYHIRMKSIPETTIWNAVNNYTKNDINNEVTKDVNIEKYYNKEGKKLFNGDPMKLFEYLYEGGRVFFDLLEGGKRCKFQSNKNFSIETVKRFIRMIQFNIM